jgi:hypothetical protein
LSDFQTAQKKSRVLSHPRPHVVGSIRHLSKKVANVPNKGQPTHLPRARQEFPGPLEGIDMHRTYRRAHLIALLPGGSHEFLKQLEEFYGLVPLGGRQPIYFGQNVLEALIRHARDERVEHVRGRVTRETLRRDKRLRRRSGSMGKK